jgi:hypothetical protein
MKMLVLRCMSPVVARMRHSKIADVRFREKSGRAADIARMTEFDRYC